MDTDAVTDARTLGKLLADLKFSGGDPALISLTTSAGVLPSMTAIEDMNPCREVDLGSNDDEPLIRPDDWAERQTAAQQRAEEAARRTDAAQARLACARRQQALLENVLLDLIDAMDDDDA